MATIKQQLSIHSEDRDILKWPNSNTFEVDLPVDYRGVACLRLNDIELPGSISVFTRANQNTRLVVELEIGCLVVEITSGSYLPSQLALELAGQLNAAVSVAVGSEYTSFGVVFNEVSQTFLFYNSVEFFKLDFTVTNLFDGSYFHNYSSWGLGYNLGFQKTTYCAVEGTRQLFWVPQTITGFLMESELPVEVYGDTHVYMEVFQCNSMDEIMPYTEGSNDLYRAKQGGKHHSAFAKIPIAGRFGHDKRMGNCYDNRFNAVSNVFRSEPPLERIQKLKFRFRYHDGRLVDFGQHDFTFTLELTLDRTDVPRLAKRETSLRAHEKYGE